MSLERAPESTAKEPWNREHKIGVVGIIVAFVIGVAGFFVAVTVPEARCLLGIDEADVCGEPRVKEEPGVLGFRGGCAPYQVYAQNRWEPYGTTVRTAPDIKAKRIKGFAGNYSFGVDGWVYASVPYKYNKGEFKSDKWFHLADGSGWVNYAAVRDAPTSKDPTGFKSGGPPAKAPADCQGNVQ